MVDTIDFFNSNHLSNPGIKRYNQHLLHYIDSLQLVQPSLI
jgi:hypothetical protein